MSNFEQKLNTQENSQEIERKDLEEALGRIRDVDIFDNQYIDDLKLVLFDETQKTFKDGKIETLGQDFDMDDFMRGRRTDFVGIHSKQEFQKQMSKMGELSDRRIVPFVLFQGELSYEEFITHEMAHNIFDIKYKKSFGEYNAESGINDVADNYREKIINSIKELANKYYPNLDVEKFNFSRQQICEIVAQLFQREFCFRAGIKSEMHQKVFQRSLDFLENPQKALEEFNSNNKKNCSLQDFYSENHTLSLLISPILEKEFPDFKERIEFFFS